VTDVDGGSCSQGGSITLTVLGTVSDPVDKPETLTVSVTLTFGSASRSGTAKPNASGAFSIVLGAFSSTETKIYNSSGQAVVTAVDPAKNTSLPGSATGLALINCYLG
jgi:hypothetical protein